MGGVEGVGKGILQDSLVLRSPVIVMLEKLNRRRVVKVWRSQQREWEVEIIRMACQELAASEHFLPSICNGALRLRGRDAYM